MDAHWINSPTGRRVLGHWADARPTWLWSGDGQTLLWRNTSARAFNARTKKHDTAAAAEAVPIRGQISRLIRLGSVNRASLSRMQFLAGDRPISATCACTPLTLDDGQTALLIVAVDPIDADRVDPAPDDLLLGLLPTGQPYLLLGVEGQVAAGSPIALERYAPMMGSGVPPVDEHDQGQLTAGEEPVGFTRYRASPAGATLLLFAPGANTATQLAPLARATPAATPPAEPLLPMGLPPLPLPPQAPVIADDHWVAPLPEPALPASGGLTSLFDRLADHEALYSPLSTDEEFAFGTPSESGPVVANAAPAEEAEPVRDEPAAVDEVPEPAPAEIAPVEGPAAIESAPDDGAPPADEPAETSPRPQLYRVIGRGFRAAGLTPAGDFESATEPLSGAEATPEPAPVSGGTAPIEPSPDAPTEVRSEAAATPTIDAAAASPGPETEYLSAEAASDPETVERVSRYNFDELSRILTDRVGGDRGSDGGHPGTPARPTLPSVPSATPEGALVTLGGETLVLNRLPLGILVFRDQQLLFANRAITEMIGYDSVEGLRAAGLAAIFPSADGEAQQSGPVNHLVQRDGTLVPVTARLQSVSWQGKPALMLSASATEVRTGHEAAVRAFAELLAATRSDGFVELARSGAINQISIEAALILGRTADQLVGKPVSAIAAGDEVEALRMFLERPARFAETARPAITVKGSEPGVELLLFAQGQAGTITGYFGFVRRQVSGGLPAIAAPVDSDPALLARLSRGVRRPLNTVIGFSDLIGSAAFGPLENERYIEYARDIKTAGLEIAALVDELDDFARLRDGRYAPRPTEIDLAALLESSVTRVRTQANAARVLVRSAISERLPRVRADRASLAQAVLNLLASAIDQSPQDGSVVLSAQVDDLGGVAINVRDSAQHLTDLGERFVVFRDGPGRDGEMQAPVRSSVGLALTRSLLAVNACSLSVDPAGGVGTLFSLSIPPENIIDLALPPPSATS